MPLTTVTDIHKEIARRREAGKNTTYRLATDMQQDRTTIRRVLAEKRDMHLSTFLGMVKALGGEVIIKWSE